MDAPLRIRRVAPRQRFVDCDRVGEGLFAAGEVAERDLRVADLDLADGDVVAPFEIAGIGGGERNRGRFALAVGF